MCNNGAQPIMPPTPGISPPTNPCKENMINGTNSPLINSNSVIATSAGSQPPQQKGRPKKRKSDSAVATTKKQQGKNSKLAAQANPNPAPNTNLLASNNSSVNSNQIGDIVESVVVKSEIKPEMNNGSKSMGVDSLVDSPDQFENNLGNFKGLY